MTVTAVPAGAEKVRVYPGFTEHAYRLVFPFEDNFAPKAPRVLTVMPSGVVETNVILKPKKEAALIAFTYPQSMPNEFVDHAVEYEEEGHEGCTETRRPKTLRETAFIWSRQNGTNALVQTWPTSVNKKFQESFEISKGKNPDTKKYEPQAVSEFQECMKRMFGDEATHPEIWFCHKETVNTAPAVSGVAENVLKHIKEDPELMRKLAILSVDIEGLGFVSDCTDGNGKKSVKHFTMTAGEHCVVYSKAGWLTMGCTKPLEQFLRDCDLHEPVAQTLTKDVQCGSGCGIM